MQFSLFDTIQSHILDLKKSINTHAIAIVESYNAEENTVDVYPAIYKTDEDGVLIKDQLLERVPVQRVGTNEISINYPLKKGDEVLLAVCQQDTEGWLISESEFVKPRTMRLFNINDCVAIPRVTKYNKSPVKNPENLEIYRKDSMISIDPDENITIETKGGNKVSISSEGAIDIQVVDTFSVSNGTGELIDWIKRLMEILEETTVNTYYGQSPLNSAPDIATLRGELETMLKGD